EDFWEIAFRSLDQNEQSQLRSVHDGPDDTSLAAVLQDTVHVVETQFQIRKLRDDEHRIRRGAKCILNSAISVRDAISGIVAADPTGHASAAWAIVSLGLKMAQNDIALQDALFESAEFLSAILARYTVVEKLSRASHVYTSKGMEGSVIYLYASILRYVIEMDRVRQLSLGERIWTSVSVPEIASHRLLLLRTSIEKEDQAINSWVNIDQNLRLGEQAEALLAGIESNAAQIQKVYQAFQLSKLPVAAEAINGSFENQYEALCLEGTRIEMLEKIVSWVDDPEGEQFFWLNGMAGTGKSTISRTLAKLFTARGILGASFFFDGRRTECASPKRFVPTILYQLTTLLPTLKVEIQAVLEKDSIIFTKTLEEQIDCVLLEPLKKLPVDQRQILIFIIDAMDQCRDKRDIRQLLRNLVKVRGVGALDLRFFITGRPEPKVCEGFQQLGAEQCREVSLHKAKGVERDIAAFLDARLNDIAANHPSPPAWPEERTIKEVAQRASPLFIVASTICLFIDDERFSPVERTSVILQHRHFGDQLVETYRTILEQMIIDTRDVDRQQILTEFRYIVGSVITLYDPLPATSLALLLDMEEDDVHLRLKFLRSVLIIPDGNEADAPIEPLHQSFPDFLVDHGTFDDNPFKISTVARNQDLAKQCLRVMCDKKIGLRRNICNLENDGILQSEISDITGSIRPVLKYACRYWLKHLLDGEEPGGQGDMYSFFQEHLLHWLEVMSILGLTSEVLMQLRSAQNLVGKTSETPLARLLLDAVQFVRRAMEPISLSPLQVYSSAIMFTPQISLIRKMFESKVPNDFAVLPQAKMNWGAQLQTSQGPCPVRSLAFGPDDCLLAFSCEGTSANVWNTEGTGSQRRLRPHLAAFDGLQLSQDDRWVAAWSATSIQLWDLNEQNVDLRPKVIETLIGDCCIVAFSHDSCRFACGFRNGIVQVWDLERIDLDPSWRGSGIRNLRQVTNVALSPDGQRLAYSSNEKEIHLWQVESSGADTMLDTLPIDVPSPTRCLCISPDSQYIACASDQGVDIWSMADKIVVRRLWDSSGDITSICYSADGRLLAHATRDIK
ncbi:WD40 repeat domain-containing protein, partial [Aspergillus aculeatinus CBS 121060]